MATPYDVVEAAYREVGTQSGKKYWDWYFGGTWSYVNGSSTPYCACFVSYILNVCGVRAPFFPSAVAFDDTDDLGGRRVSKYDLKPGDLVAFDWDGDVLGDHVGIVVGTFDGGVYTVEGNTSGGVVAECTRYYSSIICGIRPYYDDTPDTSSELEIDGWAGPKTIHKWQSCLGTDADGVISGQRHDEDEYREHVLSVDYHGHGSLLVKKVQGIVGASVDGYWGPQTSRKLQEYLIAHDYSCGGYGVDGYFGPASVKALQRSINGGLWG